MARIAHILVLAESCYQHDASHDIANMVEACLTRLATVACSHSQLSRTDVNRRCILNFAPLLQMEDISALILCRLTLSLLALALAAQSQVWNLRTHPHCLHICGIDIMQ